MGCEKVLFWNCSWLIFVVMGMCVSPSRWPLHGKEGMVEGDWTTRCGVSQARDEAYNATQYLTPSSLGTREVNCVCTKVFEYPYQ